ncbi:MAG: flagellar basal body P-ring protein FlgI [Deltaproteobacteria bacterium]|nr:flagellar basal body P-ring protein FlgI [Deltaproteobacteria bacterium]
MKALKSAAATLIFAAFLCAAQGPAWGARIKDIADIGGIRDNQLAGYGLVVGLNGTGDSVKNGFTDQTLANMLTRQGLSMKDKTLKAENVAAVMITAKLPPFGKVGSRIDVAVSSVGDAESLVGGTLLMSPLRGADGAVYAVAQGPIMVGGFSAGGSGGGVTKNHTTVGAIPNGAFIERELSYDFFDKRRQIVVNLRQPDFTTSKRVAEAIAGRIGEVETSLVDSSSISVIMKESYKGNVVDLIAAVEMLAVSVDTPAVVVLNEKTGTVVMGEQVRISMVAVAHGNLSIQIKESKEVSQPLPFSPAAPQGGGPVNMGGGVTVAPGGQTVVTSETSVGVSEEKRNLQVLPQGVTIQDVVNALNAIGVSPRDLITILQAIKAAGALQAELKII